MVKTIEDRIISDKKIRTGTGKTWKQWIAVIDALGGDKLGLITIVNCLMNKHRLTRFWSQVIAVYYKRRKRLPEYPK